MLRSVLRSAGAVALSLLVAFILVVALEWVSSILHPFPEGEFDMLEHVAAYPQWVLAFVVVWWGATTFLAAWMATRLGEGRHPAHGWCVGLLLLAAVAMNQSMLPYPLWFEVANYVVFVAATVCGARLGAGERRMSSVEA
ncbi:MAG: hypothetical protein DWQ36_14760 [Acidobacteria bacterium]|nr:MAG: hypothetical protein DWQ30_03495 [Acidobacteriota bacterium]REK06153.1 MAG: hypothetical protein DWQ36_14760 [Acidobacteriota bacterium]